MSLAATLEAARARRVPRRAGSTATVAMVTAPAGGRGYSPGAGAAFAASRTAPATAPATLSLKTLGMM